MKMSELLGACFSFLVVSQALVGVSALANLKFSDIVKDYESVTEQERKLEEKDSTIHHLMIENQRLGARVNSFETSHEQLSALFKNLNSKFSSLSSSNRHLSEQLSRLTAKVNTLENSHQTLSTPAESFRPKTEFSKSDTTGIARHETGSTPMIFEAFVRGNMTGFTEVKHTVTNDSPTRPKRPLESKANRFQQQYLSEKDNHLRQSSHPVIVAFHAVSDKEQIAHIGINQSIVFETVLLNLGNGFHSHHGVFIAPNNGIYILSASLRSYTYKYFEVAMVKNGVAVARLYGYGYSSYNDQGSVTIITHLWASDEVWLKVECCADDTLYGRRYTTFTGALLFST